MIQQTSLQTFKDIQPYINGNRKIVYDAILSHPGCCDKQLADEILRWSINRVTPRRNELVKMGLVIKGETVIYPDDNGHMREHMGWYALE